MKLRLQNPLRGSMQPWPLTERLTRFLFTAAAMLFLNAHRSILKRVVRSATGLKDPQALPEEVRRAVSTLCAASVFFLFFALGLLFAERYEAIGSFILSGLCCAIAGGWLRQKVGGIQRRPFRQSRVGQVLKRLWQVISRGSP